MTRGNSSQLRSTYWPNKLDQSSMSDPKTIPDILGAFRRHWQVATADSNLTLHGFRRFKTAHLLNLRFLEDEIAQLDHAIYQTALSMEIEPLGSDRLGLQNCRRDSNVPPPENTINRDIVIKLRDLLQSYGG